MNVPQNLKYTKEHEWIRVEGNEAYVGITDFAQGELGDIVFVEVNTIGEQVAMGKEFGTIEAVKTVSDLFCPVSGKILELNPAIESKPELINKDPYNEGWIVKIALSNPSELNELMDASAYNAMIS